MIVYLYIHNDRSSGFCPISIVILLCSRFLCCQKGGLDSRFECGNVGVEGIARLMTTYRMTLDVKLM